MHTTFQTCHFVDWYKAYFSNTWINLFEVFKKCCGKGTPLTTTLFTDSRTSEAKKNTPLASFNTVGIRELDRKMSHNEISLEWEMVIERMVERVGN